MATLGKKFSSAAAVACVWVGGSVLAQLIYLAAATAARQTAPTSSGAASAGAEWWLVALPLVVVLGGVAAIWVLRAASAWPKLSLARLFVSALIGAVFALALMPLRRPFLLALVATLLAMAAAILFTWREASKGTLGTHLFPGSTASPGEKT